MNQQVWEFFVGLFVLGLVWAGFSFLASLGKILKDIGEFIWKEIIFLRYYIWKESRRWEKYERVWLETWRDMLPDKIVKKKEWLIPEAKGYEWVLLSKVARAIRDEKIPHAKLWWSWVMYEEVRSVCLVVSHEQLIGQHLYFGSRDYGEYLKSYYFIVSDSVPLEMEREGERIAARRTSGKLDEGDAEELGRRHYEAKALMTRRDEAYNVLSVDNFTEGNLREMENFFQLARSTIEETIKEFEYNLGREKILAGATKGFVDII